MKANELRIGNWVNCFGLPMMVEPNTILSLLEIENNKKICIDLSPIPITEDEIIIVNDHFALKITKSGMCYLVNSKNNIVLLPKLVKYVHEKQNLYFALTGEELEVEL